MMRRPLDPSKPGRKAAGSTSDDRTQELMAQGHPVEMPPKPERRLPSQVAAKLQWRALIQRRSLSLYLMYRCTKRALSPNAMFF